MITAGVWVTVEKRLQIKIQRAAFTQIYMIAFIGWWSWDQPPPEFIYNTMTTGTVTQGWKQTHTAGSCLPPRRAGRAAVWWNTNNQRNYMQTKDPVLLLSWDYFSLQLCLSALDSANTDRRQMIDIMCKIFLKCGARSKIQPSTSFSEFWTKINSFHHNQHHQEGTL